MENLGFHLIFQQNKENLLYETAGVFHERTEVKNGICLFQLRRDKPPLDGALPQLRQLEHDE